MNIADMVLVVAEANPDCKQFRFKTVTHPALTKKNRTTKEPTNFTVEVRSTFTASLGVNYEDEVNSVLEAAGKPANFEAQKPSGKHYVNGTNWLMESDTVPGKFYVALSRFDNRQTAYFINGVEATPEQLLDLKANYLPKPSSKPVLVEWKTYSADSIVEIAPIR